MFPIGTRKKKLTDVVGSISVRRMLGHFRRSLQITRTENEKRLKALKNRHKTKRCFIIGNGPSLKIPDLDRLKNEITFAFNKIYLAYDATEFRPTYYIVSDSEVIKNNAERINALDDDSVKLFPYEFDYLLKADNRTIFFNFDYEYLWYSKQPKFSNNPLRCMYCGGTVATKALQLAYYMGITEVYLIGIDFSFVLPKQNSTVGLVISQGEINHFHPDYRKPGESWGTPDLDLQERFYVMAKRIFEKDGRRIFNASRGGNLNVFERVDFDVLLSLGTTASG